jgi:ABC-type transport system involved in multi-copper enzyme maturation permease subunit
MNILWNMMRNEMKLAMHNKLIFLFILFSVMAVPVMYMFDFFSAEQEMKIIKDFTFSLVSLMGIIMAVFYPIFTIKEDLERKYIYSILSKPVSRFAYILGKFAGACAVITLVCGLNFIILFLIVFVKKGELTVSYAEVSLLLLCKFYLLVAVSVLMGGPSILFSHIHHSLYFCLHHGDHQDLCVHRPPLLRGLCRGRPAQAFPEDTAEFPDL